MDQRQRQAVCNVRLSELSSSRPFRFTLMVGSTVLGEECECTVFQLQHMETGKYVCLRRVSGECVRPRDHSRIRTTEEAVSTQGQ